MKRLIIAYHSQSGACAQLSHAALRGAQREAGIQVERHRAWDIGAADLRAGDGLLCVTAENSGALSGGMKDFLDRVFYPAINLGLVLPYGVLISGQRWTWRPGAIAAHLVWCAFHACRRAPDSAR